MSYLKLFGIIFGIHLLAVMSPGPDFVMVLRSALQYKRKTAIYTALGISMGIAIHVLYSVFGIALLLQKNQHLFNFIKIAGALYIIYMGIKTLKERQKVLSFQNSGNAAPTSWQAIKTGFITNVLNPKASLFFLSIFSVLIPPDTPARILTGIGIMLIVVTFLWFALVSIIFTNKKVVKHYEKYEKYIINIFGIILILLGLSIIFE